MDFFERLHQIKTDLRFAVPLLVINCAAALFGWYYYVQAGQFVPSDPRYVHWSLWPLVSDSPNAVVLLFLSVLLLHVKKWRSKWLDSAAFILNIYVGLWTTMFHMMFPEYGAYDFGSTNNILFIAHMGMPLQALILVHDLRQDSWSWKEPAIMVAAATVYIVVDYFLPFGPVIHPGPWVHPDDAALHIGSSILMVVSLAAFAAVIMTGRGPRRTTRQ